MNWRLFSCVAFLAIIPVSYCNVPVLMWNTHTSKDVNVPAVSALQEISVSSLQARYFDAFKPNNVLLFLQDALSIEDLSSHADDYEHVNKWMEAAGHKLYLPNVVQPSHLQHDLIQQGYKVTKLSAGSAISELQLDRTAKNLVVIKLPPTITNPSRSRALRKADEVMQSVLSKIGDMAEFTVIYTGMKPAKEQPASTQNTAPRTRIARSLQQFGATEEIPINFHNTSCVAVYIRQNMTLSLDGVNFSDLPENDVHNEGLGDCGNADNPNGVQTVKMSYSNVALNNDTYYKVAVELFFSQDGGYFRSPFVEVDLQLKSTSIPTTKNLTFYSYDTDGIAIGKSYSCNDVLIYREPTELNVTNVMTLHLNGVQMQAFMDDTSKFGPSWDCVGFFSIGTWAGLLVAFLLIIILAIGMFQLSEIKTMDRFDDPKGKMIAVPTSSD